MNSPTPADLEIDEIRRRMAEIRHKLHQDVSEVVGSAGRAFEWQAYVRDYPWLVLGAAFGLGYLIVPHAAKSKGAAASSQVEPTQTVRAIRGDTGDVSTPSQKEAGFGPFSLMRWGWTLLGPVAMQAAQSYAASWLETKLAQYPHGGPPAKPAEEPRLNPAGMPERPRRF